jgi:hypothetical protein
VCKKSETQQGETRGKQQQQQQNNNTMDDDYQDDEVIEYDATRATRETRNHPAPPSRPFNIPEASQVYYDRIQETIANNQLSPLSENQFDEWKGNIEGVFTQIKTGFGPNEYKSVDEFFSKLLKAREYRESMAVFPDLMLIMVDIMMEAGIDVFPTVNRGTRILQEMFRKYAIAICESKYSHGSHNVFLSRVFPNPKRRSSCPPRRGFVSSCLTRDNGASRGDNRRRNPILDYVSGCRKILWAVQAGSQAPSEDKEGEERG